MSTQIGTQLKVPTTGSTGALGRKQAEFATYRVYDAPVVEGGQPVWFANISFLKENKETGEFYLQQLVDVGLHHSFMSADETLDRPTTSKENIASRFAQLKA